MFKSVVNYFKALSVLFAVKQVFPAKHGDRRIIFQNWAIEYETPFIWRVWQAEDFDEQTERLMLETCSPPFVPPRFSLFIDGVWVKNIKTEIRNLYRGK